MLDQQWKVVRELNGNSILVLAFTVWALLSAYDWDSLVTEKKIIMSRGAFNLVAGQSIPIALNSMICAICTGKAYEHPALSHRR